MKLYIDPIDEKELNKRIGQRISHYLELLGMTQLDLAKKMNVSPASVNYWIKGVKMPRMPKIDMICEILGVTRSQLIDEHSSEEEAQFTKAMDLYKKYQALSPDKQAEFQHYLEYLQSKS